MQTYPTTLRSFLTIAVVLGVLIFISSGDVLAQKEFLLEGTVDCGRKSGADCDIGTLITVWTSAVSGKREKVVVDVSWVQKDLDRYDQDNRILPRSPSDARRYAPGHRRLAQLRRP